MLSCPFETAVPHSAMGHDDNEKPVTPVATGCVSPRARQQSYSAAAASRDPPGHRTVQVVVAEEVGPGDEAEEVAVIVDHVQRPRYALLDELRGPRGVRVRGRGRRG